MLYEKTDNSSTESDETDSSDEESIKIETAKKYVSVLNLHVNADYIYRRRIDVSSTSQTNGSYLSSGKSVTAIKKKKSNPVRQTKSSHNPQSMVRNTK